MKKESEFSCLEVLPAVQGYEWLRTGQAVVVDESQNGLTELREQRVLLGERPPAGLVVGACEVSCGGHLGPSCFTPQSLPDALASLRGA